MFVSSFQASHAMSKTLQAFAGKVIEGVGQNI